MNKHFIIGLGEIGQAYKTILSEKFEVKSYDKREGELQKQSDYVPDVLHICIPFVDDYLAVVKSYVDFLRPKITNIMTTVPPGTTSKLGWNSCHSTTRIMHSPARPETAVEFIRTIPKHIGGCCAGYLADIFEECGIECICESRPEVTEVAHILNNIEYGVLSAFTDEKWRICRMYGVDPLRAVHAYTQSYNDGYSKMGHGSKCRPILFPPQGHIGGHCVCQNAEMIAPVLRDSRISSPMVEMLANFNK